MDPSEYDLEFFHRNGFQRRTCRSCGSAFWTLGDHDRCQEAPCTPYAFIGAPGFARPLGLSAMREAYLGFFEKRGHARIRRYPVVARWRGDVFFVQASIYDFQPWVTSGQIPPPANPLTISQPCIRFIDLEEVGHSGRHFTEFEMMAHHAFNRPDHSVYFKDRCTELCHELLVDELGADARKITYKEEEWEGGGNLGPSLSVGLLGLEVATLVFMEYTRDGDRLKPMPLTVVDTGYGLERFTWMGQGTRTAYEAAFGPLLTELGDRFPLATSSMLLDHARALNFLITDGVVPSNTQEGYYVRLLIRRMLRTLASGPEGPELLTVLDRVARDQGKDFPELGQHRDDLHKVVRAEIERFEDSTARARVQIRRQVERLGKSGGSVGLDQFVEWYDSLGITPDVAAQEIRDPPAIPENFYALVARRHEQAEARASSAEERSPAPEVPSAVAPTEVLYYTDPYTVSFRAHVLWSSGPWVVLDRTYFYPTGGGQITDTGHLGEAAVVDVLRQGGWVLHRLEGTTSPAAGEEVHGRIDAPRRRQLMQHHTATHLLNGALRQVLGPHVWQAGAYKGTDLARIDITHYRALEPAELREVDRLVHEVIRENRPVKSYFELRSEAEKRFGFTLYQGGAVPGRELRIVEIEGFDVEACGGTHCTHTSEVGFVQVLGTERIQDGVVRLMYAAGERALEVREQHETVLRESARKLAVPAEKLPEGIDRVLAEVEDARRARRSGRTTDLKELSAEIVADPQSTTVAGPVRVSVRQVALDPKAMQELARRLSSEPGTVAVLSTESEGVGRVIVGSNAPTVPANEVLAAMNPEFGGKGGGNPSVATASGEPGTALGRAVSAGRAKALALAGGAPVS
ncbi:MAG TPA: alanine--tRNA ligase [Thermoplasmata archaeon]|nr:alanine--tRNA ligase [Thermoplasmata archaeon]